MPECTAGKSCINLFMGDWCSVCNKRPMNVNYSDHCQYFRAGETCMNCKHAIKERFDADILEMEEYRCPFLNNKVTYKNYATSIQHEYDFPECKIGRWERKED